MAGVLPAPARANAAYGRDIEAWWVEGMTDLILQAVRGENLFNRPRWPAPSRRTPLTPRLSKIFSNLNVNSRRRWNAGCASEQSERFLWVAQRIPRSKVQLDNSQ